MILTCDQCQSRYLVPGHAIGAEGKRVRCTGCGHEWVQMPEEEALPESPEEKIQEESVEERPQEIEPIPESVNPEPEMAAVSVISGKAEQKAGGRKGVFAGYLAAAMVFFVIAGGLIAAHESIARYWPSSILFYDLVGLQTEIEGEDLIFDQPKAIVALNKDGVNILTVQANILNLSRKVSKVPLIQTTMIGTDGRIVDRWLTEPEKNLIEKEGDMAFRTTYPEISDDVKEVNIKFILGTALKTEKRHTLKTEVSHERESHP